MTHIQGTASVHELEVPVCGAVLHGTLAVPPDATAVVIFAHGSGSSRRSPRNRFVARQLQEAGLATLLLDLLTELEAFDRRFVFDIDLLAPRLRATTEYVLETAMPAARAIGYFGASTGAAAALVASVDDPRIAAVVSRGGRPDLAGPLLRNVTAPTLLIVGSADHEVLDLNRAALAQLSCEQRLSIVPGATHLFEERGTLEQAAALARDWFVSHLAACGAAP